MAINVVLIRTNGLTCTFQASSWEQAIEAAVEKYDAQMRDYVDFGLAPYKVCYMSDGEDGLEQHSFKDLRIHLEHIRKGSKVRKA